MEASAGMTERGFKVIWAGLIRDRGPATARALYSPDTQTGELTMSVERIEAVERSPYAGGVEFGEVGAYELIRARLHYAVDPERGDRTRIVDLQHAPRDADGCVRYSGELVLLRPVDASRGNGALLVDVPNRGRPVAPGVFNRSPRDQAVADPLHPGDGFLMRHGFAVAEVAWQWNTPDAPTLLTFDAPDALVDDREGHAYADVRPNKDADSWPISHLAQPGYAAADTDDPTARLYVREYEDQEPTEIPRERWRFAEVGPGGLERPSAHHILLEGGLEAGRIYEVTYRAERAPVVGTGLLAFRDAARFLRDWEQPYERVIGHGVSQSGRFLRHLLYLGLNQDPDKGGRVFDGMHIHVAGGIRGEFNHRYAQTSQLFSASFAHLFPFTDTITTDPLTGQRDGVLKRSDEQGVTPRIVATNTSWEYWRGDASLLRIDPLGPDGPRDLPEHPLVRHYHLSGTQHGSGALPQTDTFDLSDDRGAHGFNVVDYSPLTRAALVHLDRWIADGAAPPASAHPRVDDGSAASRGEVLEHFEQHGPVVLDAERLSRVRTIDLGPGAARGAGEYPTREGAEYAGYVSAIDSDGNEIAGVRLPEITSPVATHTGWNPRHESNGAPDLSAHFVGFTKFWSAEAINRRYPTREAYRESVTRDARQLVESRRILVEDEQLVINNALACYDAAIAGG